MNEFLDTLLDPDFGFLRMGLLVGAVASVVFGIVGSLVVVRRISYVAGAIAHAVLGGIGPSLYLREVYGWDWLHPLYGAFASAVLAALVIGTVQSRGHFRSDSAIGAVWAVGMAVGLIFISLTPGYADPMSYLFGSLLILGRFEGLAIFAVAVGLLTVVFLFYPKIQAVCFDEEFARLRGIPVDAYNFLLLVLVAVSIVLLVSVVGVVLVVALLTMPAAIASRWMQSLLGTMVVAALLTCFCTLTGISLSYLSDWPTGPTIILLAGGLFILASFGKRRIR